MDIKTLELFTVHAPVLELVLRGAVIYLLLFVLFHFLVRHATVHIGILEMVALVLIADVSQNAMAGETTSIAESAILAAAMFASHALMRAAYVLRHRLVRRRRTRRIAA
jgi:uncharacterized membrane protein YcaP (DUF421 family)